MTNISHAEWHNRVSQHVKAALAGRRPPLAVLTGALASVAMFLAPMTASAAAANATQSADAIASGSLREIIVTARFRKESLQNSPLSMTASALRTPSTGETSLR